MSLKPYQPSNKLTQSGLTWLTLSSVIGGVVIGGLTHLISRLIYLVILFPLLMGFLGGLTVAAAVQVGKVRNPKIAALFGVATGLILYGSLHGADYLQFRHEASQEILRETSQADATQIEPLIDAYLQEQTNSTGFVGYLKYSAQQGVSIGRVGSSGANLGETGTWIYWLVELGIIEVIIVLMAYGNAKSPFCENCDQWYPNAIRLGRVEPESKDNFLNLVQSDQFSRAGALIDPIAATTAASLEVSAQSCPSCRISEPFLIVNSASADEKGKISLNQVAQGLISQSQYHKLQEAIQEGVAQKNDGVEISQEEMRLAQAERSTVTASDPFEPHNLSPEQVSDLTQQLAQYREVKEAYLVCKTMQYFPEKPLYVLGIVRKKNWIESEEEENKVLGKLSQELRLPNQTWLMGLNKDKAMAQALKSAAGQPIYSK